MGSCRRFLGGIPHQGVGSHVLLTRPPLPLARRRKGVRLACVRHAASVYPEPGSNSPSCFIKQTLTEFAFSCMLSDPGQAIITWLFRRFSHSSCGLQDERNDSDCSLFTVAVLLSTFQLSRCNQEQDLPTPLSAVFRQVHQACDQLLTWRQVASSPVIFLGETFEVCLPEALFTRHYRRRVYYAIGLRGCQGV
jgi:hypothetical protein